MTRLEHNTIKINSEETFDMDVLARDASLRNSSRFIFRFAQAGLFIASNILLHRRVADPEPSSAFRRPADILKGGNENGNLSVHSKSVGLLSDCGRGRPVLLAGVEEPLSGLPCPEFKRIIDITYKLTKWMKNVKIKIARNGKDKMDKGKPCEEKI